MTDLIFLKTLKFLCHIVMYAKVYDWTETLILANQVEYKPRLTEESFSNNLPTSQFRSDSRKSAWGCYHGPIRHFH